MFTKPARLGVINPKHITAAVLYSVGGIVLLNITMLWLSGIFGWKVFAHCWPLEIVAAQVCSWLP